MEPIQTNRLLQIKHAFTQHFLSGTPFHVTMFGKVQIDNADLTYTKDEIEELSFFTLECDKQNSSTIYYGDMVYIRNFKTQLYVNQESKPQLTEKKQPFVIQPILEHGQSCEIYLDRTIDTQFRLFSPENMKYLCISDNQNWKFVNGHYQKVILPPIDYQPKYVHKKDTVIIRNWWTGMTLHSHKDHSRYCNEQEITCFTYPRDENDRWIILKPQEQSLITHTSIHLQHRETGLYLSGAEKESFSKLGYQAFCSHEQKSVTFEQFDNLPLELYKPFRIRINLYLTQMKHANENEFGMQQECALGNCNEMSFWVIE